MVGLYFLAVLCLKDGHRGRARERLAKRARVRRIEVLDEHERHPGVGREVFEQLRKRLEPAGGRTDADDWRGGTSVRSCREIVRGFWHAPRFHVFPVPSCGRDGLSAAGPLRARVGVRSDSDSTSAPCCMPEVCHAGVIVARLRALLFAESFPILQTRNR
jgi:hypothetical protein